MRVRASRGLKSGRGTWPFTVLEERKTPSTADMCERENGFFLMPDCLNAGSATSRNKTKQWGSASWVVLREKKIRNECQPSTVWVNIPISGSWRKPVERLFLWGESSCYFFHDSHTSALASSVPGWRGCWEWLSQSFGNRFPQAWQAWALAEASLGTLLYSVTSWFLSMPRSWKGFNHQPCLMSPGYLLCVW